MLDENLPTFYLKPNDQQKHVWTIYLCQHGDDPEPAYTLRYPDPSSPSSKNRYAVALCDPFVPDVVYGEILIIPEWTQPSLSAEAIRLNGGVTPPPEPVLPSQFSVHLYNPDQQVTIRYKHKTWNTPATWEFEMPQHTFRQPSASTLDRTQSDPAVADTTPKLRFSWRKDSKLSKDLTCLLSGKTSTLPEGRTKSKEPDITLSIFKALRELTLYEPNLYRVEMEDFKGLEIVLLLGAVTIRDVYFTPMKDSFRLARDEVRKPVAGPTGSAVNVASTVQNGVAHSQKPTPVASNTKTNDKPPAPRPPAATQPPTTQHKKKQELSRKEEEKRTKKRLEEEEKARRKRQAEIDKETRRLQKIYGHEEQQVRASRMNLALAPAPPAQPPRPQPPPRQQQQLSLWPNPRYYYHQQAPSTSHLMPGPSPPRPHSTVHFAQPRPPPGSVPAPRPQSTMLRPPGQGQQPQLQPKKSSFFGFRRTSEDAKLHKKRSSMF